MAEKAKKTVKKKTTTKSSPAKSSGNSVSSNTKNTKSNNNQLLIVLLLALVVIQLGISISILTKIEGSSSAELKNIAEKVNDIDNFFSNNVDGYGSGSPNQGQGQTAPSGDPVEIDIEGEPFLGDENAPVTIIEFSDYECPFCARFYSESMGQLKEEYIETGKVKLVYKDFPLSFHQNALPAAISANCVHKELGNEAYFTLHDILFENIQSLTTSNLKSWALEVGASESFYDTCIEDPEMAQEANADLAEGSQNGVSGTPSFFINGNLIVGAQPYSVIKQAIEAELNN